MRPRLALRVLAASLLSTVIAPPLLPVAAHAQAWSHVDAIHDVVVTNDDLADQEPAPQDRSSDVRRVSVDHTPNRIRVRVRVRDVTPGNQVLALAFVGSNRIYSYISLLRAGGRDRLTSQILDGHAADARRCGQATGQIQPRKNQVTITVATTCWDNPNWVRVSALYAAFDGRPASVDQFKVDDGLDAQLNSDGETKFSPRIHVG